MEEEPGREGLRIFLALLKDEPIEPLLTEEQHKALIAYARANGSKRVERPSPIPIQAVLPPPPETQQQLPAEFQDFLVAKGATGNNSPKLIFIKKLFETDVKPHNKRLTMPNRQKRQEFLTEQEKQFIEGRDEKGKPNKMQVIVLDPSMKEQSLNLAKWNAEHDGSWSYALNHDWMKIVAGKQLTTGDIIQVWAFRIERIGHSSLAFLIYKERREDRGSTRCS